MGTNPLFLSEKVIVIGRQFGSGGRLVGQELARMLGCRYFDKELLAEAAGSLGISPELFLAADERRPSPFRQFLQGAYGLADNFHITALSGEKLYQAQCEVIRKLCSESDCVVVGRTADYVMRDHPGLVSVFLHSPADFRAKMIVERNDATTISEALELARRNDRARENYYNYYTGRNWGHASNYHLTADVSLLGHRETACLIRDFIGKRKIHR